jgi:hypothetical protein
MSIGTKDAFFSDVKKRELVIIEKPAAKIFRRYLIGHD